MSLNIKPEHIESKKKIGKLRGKPVIELKTTGGFHMVVSANDSGGFETLGTGPHKAVARHIAAKREPEIEWTELSKSDYVDPVHFQHLLPEYEAVTETLRDLQKGEVIQGNFPQHQSSPATQGPPAPVVNMKENPVCKCGQYTWDLRGLAKNPPPYNKPKGFVNKKFHSPERCGQPTIFDLE